MVNTIISINKLEKQPLFTYTIDSIENNLITFDINYLNINIGSLEIFVKDDYVFIENIHVLPQYRGKGVLRCTLNMLLDTYKKNIKCMPLPQHRVKFEHLGFNMDNTIHTKYEEDIFYQYKIA